MIPSEAFVVSGLVGKVRRRDACRSSFPSRGRIHAPVRRSRRLKMTGTLVPACWKRHTEGDVYTTVMVVPTGVGSTIGGYAGDALPAARLLAAVSDRLVAHPNILNGAMAYWPIPNALYVEGYALDKFCQGSWGLVPVTSTRNRIGVIFDAAIEDDLLQRHIQVCDAARATLGVEIVGYTVTREPVGVSLGNTERGASTGTFARPDVLVEAAETLLSSRYSCDALALVCRFPEEHEDETSAAAFAAYRHGDGVDAVGGAEALLSHFITERFRVPCAHAPALRPLNVDPQTSPKAAAEELGYTFLPCVLVGLSRAPRVVEPGLSGKSETASSIWSQHIDAAVAPYNALNGPGITALLEQRKLVIAVEENRTCMDASPETIAVHAVRLFDTHSKALITKTSPEPDRPCVLVARSYAEAAGYLAAHRAGILLNALTPHVPRTPRILLQDHPVSVIR